MMIIVTITYSITTLLPFILLSAAVIHSHFDQQQKKENNRRMRQRKLLNWKIKKDYAKKALKSTMMIIGGVTISYSIIFSLHFLLLLAAAALVLQSTKKKEKQWKD